MKLRLALLVPLLVVGLCVSDSLPVIGLYSPEFAKLCALPAYKRLALGLDILLYVVFVMPFVFTLIGLVGDFLRKVYHEGCRCLGIKPEHAVLAPAAVLWASVFWGMLVVNAHGVSLAAPVTLVEWPIKSVVAACGLPAWGLQMFLQGLRAPDRILAAYGLLLIYGGLAPLIARRFLVFMLLPPTLLPQRARVGTESRGAGPSFVPGGQTGSRPQPAATKPAQVAAPQKGRDPHAFDGLVGLDEPIAALKMALELPALYPDRVKKYGLEVDRGLLLVGPPGTGKTSLARAAARYFGCAFRSISTPQLLGSYVGQSEQNLHSVFVWARQNRPCILFFDEIDAIGRKRDGAHLNRPHDVLLDVLLQELDGFEDRTGVFVLAATNRPDVLDEALVRPGRFDRIIHIGLPDRQARLKLFDLFLRGKPGWGDFDRGCLERLADLTEGRSPAEIKSLVNEAVRRAAFENEPVRPRHFGL